MREDMAKVIVERPRIVDYRPRKGRARPLDELPKQLGMRHSRQERHGERVLNENLNPLRRFLEREVSRPWDKVYSEIAARLRADSTVQRHVRDHLEGFFAIRPRRGVLPSYCWGDGLWYEPLYTRPAVFRPKGCLDGLGAAGPAFHEKDFSRRLTVWTCAMGLSPNGRDPLPGFGICGARGAQRVEPGPA
jgi:hypothetical protein